MELMTDMLTAKRLLTILKIFIQHLLSNHGSLKCILSEIIFVRSNQKTEKIFERNKRAKIFQSYFSSVQFQFGNFIEHDKKKKRIKYVMLLFKQHRSTCLFALPQPVRPEMRHQMYCRIDQKRKGELVKQAQNTNSN